MCVCAWAVDVVMYLLGCLEGIFGAQTTQAVNSCSIGSCACGRFTDHTSPYEYTHIDKPMMLAQRIMEGKPPVSHTRHIAARSVTMQHARHSVLEAPLKHTSITQAYRLGGTQRRWRRWRIGSRRRTCCIPPMELRGCPTP